MPILIYTSYFDSPLFIANPATPPKYKIVNMANVGGFSPSYSWVGKPTQFNGTNQLTGGDSCELPIQSATEKE